MLSWWNRVRGRIVAAQAAAADPDRKPTRFERLMNLLPPFWLAARVEMGPGLELCLGPNALGDQ